MTLNRIYLAILAVLVIISFKPPYFIETFELRIYDLLVRYTAPGKPDQRVVIVGIDQKSLDNYGRWPWPRDVIGKLVHKLAGYGAKVTALDIVFSTQADKGLLELTDKIEKSITTQGVNARFPEFYREFGDIKKELRRDEALASAMKSAGNVVTGFIFHGKEEEAYIAAAEEQKHPLIQPFKLKMVQRDTESGDAHIWFNVSGAEPNIPMIQEAGASSGFLNTWTDPDGSIRSHPMVIEYKDEFYPSLALAAAMLYEGSSADTRARFAEGLFAGVNKGDEFLRTDPYGRMLISYLGPDGTFPTVSAADVLSQPADDAALKKALEGKIAFVGATATQIYDLRVTPFGITAGVEVQANAASAALNNMFISKMGWQNLYDMALTLVIGLLLLFALKRINVFLGLALTIMLFGALFGFNYFMFAAERVWLNSVTPGLTIILGFITATTYQYVAEQKSKRFIKEAFGHYLSPKVIGQIIDNPGLLKLGGDKRVMTAYFSDVAGFTTISEKLAPTELVLLLNDYLSAMSEVIHELDGTVDKYEGDAIIAFWGAPLETPDHAKQCVTAAVRMQRLLTVMREKWRAEGKDELRVRMGINTGPMVVGNMGSKDRMDYTIMGDSVNLAARLEGINKYYGTSILVSEFTHAHVKDYFICRELDMVRVAGKKDAIRLYEVMEETVASTDQQRRFTQYFSMAVLAFRRMEFKTAAEIFTSCDRLRPGGDGACKLYLKRCAELIESRPSEGWDMVYDLAK